MNGTNAYIPDGYTTDGFIAEQPRLHPAARFVYRPCVSVENGIIDDAIRKATAARGEMIAAECCAGHLVSWDVVDEAGAPLAVEAVKIVRLQPTLFSKLFGVIRGSRAGDIDPDNVDNRSAEGTSDELQAALAGKTVEEVTAGNSPAG